MSVDLGLVPMTPQTGHCARASQALLKELLGKGLTLPPFRKFILGFALRDSASSRPLGYFSLVLSEQYSAFQKSSFAGETVFSDPEPRPGSGVEASCHWEAVIDLKTSNGLVGHWSEGAINRTWIIAEPG